MESDIRNAPNNQKVSKQYAAMQWTTGDADGATYGQTTPSALCAAFGSDVGGLHAQVDRTRQVLFRNFPLGEKRSTCGPKSGAI
jgi:hypothetical protein